MEDEQEYLRRVQAELQQAKDRYQVLLKAFDAAVSTDALTTSLQEIPYIEKPDSVQKALNLFLNKQQDKTVRALAVQKITSVKANDERFITSCLSVIHDPNEPAGLRSVVMTVLATLSFSSRVFTAMRPEYFAVLRDLLDDPDDELRESATGVLANNNDETVQNRLLRGLKGEQEPLVMAAKAIQLLARDTHFNYYPTVREILQNPVTKDIEKVEAIHALAFDQESKPLIARIFNDKSEANEVRMSSAAAFQAAHPTDFIELAKTVILDESDTHEVRAASLNALIHLREADTVFNDDEFVRNIGKLAEPAPDNDLKKMSEKYLEKANQFLNKK